MAYQQQQVLCQPAAWTPICEYRPTRKSLIIQVPPIACESSFGNATLTDTGVATTILPTDIWRRAITFVVGQNDCNVIVGVGPGGGGYTQGGITVSQPGALNPPVILDGSYPDGPNQASVQSEWCAGNKTPATSCLLEWLTVSYQLVGVILATAQNPSVAGGPFGSAPPGNWLSSDLSAGPASFRLQADLDGDQTIQQWFAWPVGSIAVNVTVSEAFEVVIPPPPPKYLTVQLPQLSPEAMQELQRLQASLTPAGVQATTPELTEG